MSTLFSELGSELGNTHEPGLLEATAVVADEPSSPIPDLAAMTVRAV